MSSTEPMGDEERTDGRRGGGGLLARLRRTLTPASAAQGGRSTREDVEAEAAAELDRILAGGEPDRGSARAGAEPGESKATGMRRRYQFELEALSEREGSAERSEAP